MTLSHVLPPSIAILFEWHMSKMEANLDKMKANADYECQSLVSTTTNSDESKEND